MTLLFLLLPCASIAGEADVIAAEVEHVSGDFIRFKVTIRHADEGWGHYAQRFEVLDMAGNVLAVRVLRHPHIKEQSITRSLTTSISAEIEQVMIRAYDSVHKIGGAELTLDIIKD